LVHNIFVQHLFYKSLHSQLLSGLPQQWQLGLLALLHLLVLSSYLLASRSSWRCGSGQAAVGPWQVPVLGKLQLLGPVPHQNLRDLAHRWTGQARRQPDQQHHQPEDGGGEGDPTMRDVRIGGHRQAGTRRAGRTQRRSIRTGSRRARWTTTARTWSWCPSAPADLAMGETNVTFTLANLAALLLRLGGRCRRT